MAAIDQLVHEGLLTESQFIRSQDIFVIDDIQHSDHGCSVGCLVYLDLAQGLKTFTAIDRTVTMQIGNVFTIGFNTDLAKF